MNIKKVLLHEIIQIINNIRESKYQELKKRGMLINITEDEIKKELNEYGGILTEASIDEYEEALDIIEISNTNTYKVYMDLWINGIRSDLTIICDITMNDIGKILNSSIEDIHVL
ncbi:DUF7668 domain-containing protein [Clostridium botulinum]|uniref:DUF7668 domain-containing protein n=1 Tax=Clostridium botulinum TaxID=1491 RepID=A0A9Q1UYJ4_CLOBO|nr:hypothetical protein [Clostridium botulinum]AEB75044.1 hypothetical protein CbC4_0364 [Clostridium botulinum BKT015925]KEI04210.1 hypothetical protein Y848_02510 [Clostridium botulinum C/D str. Sp77]KLU74972.1 hypothetical protein CBC3_10940 [Clostridium botulinum V891]KOA77975.1 hypothetical protein ADU78_02580 [Clostridium botulinum]KOA79898.1 hypothetical protein ADU77_02635 [Clostridium botulinum]